MASCRSGDMKIPTALYVPVLHWRTHLGCSSYSASAAGVALQLHASHSHCALPCCAIMLTARFSLHYSDCGCAVVTCLGAFT
jgi:hypothetical protein